MDDGGGGVVVVPCQDGVGKWSSTDVLEHTVVHGDGMGPPLSFQDLQRDHVIAKQRPQ
jgi:hypothetical protein